MASSKVCARFVLMLSGIAVAHSLAYDTASMWSVAALLVVVAELRDS